MQPSFAMIVVAPILLTSTFPTTLVQASPRSVVPIANRVDTHQTNGQYRFTVADPGTPDVRFDHVWARPTAAGATTGAVYFSVTATTRPDRLTGASSPVAATTELHQTINDNGVMKMRAVPSIDLIPGKPVVFNPGGYHVMLTGLKSALKPGDSFPPTLTFEHAPPVTVTAKVEATGGAGTTHGGMEHMPGMQGH